MFLAYPKYIALEVTNHCPMKCIHCPHGHGLIKHKGLMSWELFTSVIDDVSSWKHETSQAPQIVLYGNGEPLVHHRITDFVQYCTDKGLSSNLSTNIMLATKEHARHLSNAGLSAIKLSFWGDNKTEYESRTTHQKFEEAIWRAKEFIENTGPAVKVIINVVKYRMLGQTLELAPEFVEHFKHFPNTEFYCFYGSDWRGTLDVPELKIPLVGQPKHEPCSMAGNMIPISWEGKVVFCWIDYNREYVLGEYHPGSLLEYWNSTERRRRLTLMTEGRFCEMELCKNCSAPYSENFKERVHMNKNRTSVVVGKQIYDPDFLKHAKEKSL